jgi:hypothetical protein
MSVTGTPQQNPSRDGALAAIAQAHGQIGRADEQLVQLDRTAFKPETTKDTARQSSKGQPLASDRSPGASSGRLVLRSLIGLLALAGIGVAAFAWQSTRGQAVPEPLSTASVSIEKTQLMAQSVPTNAEVAAKVDTGLPQSTSQAQATLQHAVPVAPTVAAMTPDPTDSIQIIARELANTVQGIDQLKSGQAQLVRDNAELAEHLKATQEAARHNADLAEDLKATLTQMARDNVNFAEQLKANREQMANITEQLKGSQEQIARLGASDQKPRPRTPASSPLPIASSSRRPVPPRPSPPQARVQTHDSRDQDTIRQ